MNTLILPTNKVGINIDRIRRSLGWTQEEFALHANIDVRTARRWFRGLGLDSITNVNLCAQVLGVDVRTILFGE